MALKHFVKRLVERFPRSANFVWKIVFPYTGLSSRSIVVREPAGDEDSKTRRGVFGELFRSNGWSNLESVSGYGSTIFNTLLIRRDLPSILERFDVTTLLDAPCGDLNWMGRLILPDRVNYTGADIVPELVASLKDAYQTDRRQFVVMDIVEGPIPPTDFWLCRDTLFHLSFADGMAVIRNASESVKYFATTTHNFVGANSDTSAGGFRFINLMLPPCSLPPPVLLIDDFLAPMPPQQLGIWTAQQLRKRLVG